jgi:hypothetical protein
MKQGQFILRVYEMVEAFNRNRKPNDPLVVDDPGQTYCRIRTVPSKDGSYIVYWWLNIQTGDLLPSSKITPSIPYEPPRGAAPWPYNIANEDPTLGFSALGVMQRGNNIPSLLDLSPTHIQFSGNPMQRYGQDYLNRMHYPPYSATVKSLEKCVHDPCIKPDRVYTNYALEA